MVTYKELKDTFLEEVAKIDVSALDLSFPNALKEYAELLKVIATLPEDTYDNRLKSSSVQYELGAVPRPKIKK